MKYKKMPFKKGHLIYSIKGQFKKGQTPYNKGKKFPKWKMNKEGKEKIRKAALERYKDKTKHPSYKDGRTFEKNYHQLVSRQRQIRKLGNTGSHTNAEWETLKAQYNWTCPCCRQSEPFNQWNKQLTKDHIIPLNKGGSDNIENIQPLCRHCNAKKYTHIIKY